MYTWVKRKHYPLLSSAYFLEVVSKKHCEELYRVFPVETFISGTRPVVVIYDVIAVLGFVIEELSEVGPRAKCSLMSSLLAAFSSPTVRWKNI